MKKLLAITALLALAFAVGSCGSPTISPLITTGASGNWEATLSGGIGEASKLDFNVTFDVGAGGGPLNITNFSFLNSNSCFVSVQTYTGVSILTTNTQNQVTGSMAISIASLQPGGNVLKLTTQQTTVPNTTITLPGGQVSGLSNNGVLTNGAVTGNWILTNTNNPSCSGYGTFLMCQGAPTCSPTIT